MRAIGKLCNCHHTLRLSMLCANDNMEAPHKAHWSIHNRPNSPTRRANPKEHPQHVLYRACARFVRGAAFN